MKAVRAVVFDLGGVLVDWNPRHLYRHLIPDPVELEHFLTEICPQSWNELQDAGRPLAEATRERIARHPRHADLIAAYYGRWEAMLSGPIEGTVALLEALDAAGVPLYALSNWSAELFPIARRRFDFIGRFRAIVVSGEEGVIKPDPEIFGRLLGRHGLEAPHCLFIDDNPANVAAADRLGFRTHLFRTPELLSEELAALGLL